MVRKYTDKPIPVNIVEKLNERVRENNERYGLSIRLMTNDGSAVAGAEDRHLRGRAGLSSAWDRGEALLSERGRVWSGRGWVNSMIIAC